MGGSFRPRNYPDRSREKLRFLRSIRRHGDPVLRRDAVMDVRLVYGQKRDLAIARLEAEWGGPVVARGVTFEFDECEILMAGEMAGLAAISGRDQPIAELVA